LEQGGEVDELSAHAMTTEHTADMTTRELRMSRSYVAAASSIYAQRGNQRHSARRSPLRHPIAPQPRAGRW